MKHTSRPPGSRRRLSPVQAHGDFKHAGFLQVHLSNVALLAASPGIGGIAPGIAVFAQRIARLTGVVAVRPEVPALLHLGAIGPPPRRRRSLALGAEALADDLLEREAEVFGEERVYEGIDGAVAIAQPEHRGEHQGRDALLAEGAHYVHGEERKPAENESPDYYPQRFRGFGFHAESLHLSFNVPLPHPLGDDLRLPTQALLAHARTGAPTIVRFAAVRSLPDRMLPN